MPPCAIWPWEQWLPRLCQANLASTLKQLLSGPWTYFSLDPHGCATHVVQNSILSL